MLAWHRSGQILVELAVALPFIMFLILGAVEFGLLLIAKADQDHRTVVVAEWAAGHPGESWNAVADYELEGCDVTVTMPKPDLIEAKATCPYDPVVLKMWSGLKVSSEAQAASQSASPKPTPVASPSSSSTTALGRRLV